jgi:DNA mismatch repair protein MutL
MNLYILCRRLGGGEEALVVIDQHAAHERLIFETLKKQFAAQRVVSQALLFPQLVDLTRDQVQILKQYQREIARLGLEVEEFGEESYVIKAVPAILTSLAPEEILGAVLEQFQDSGAGSSERLRDANARMDDILSSMACKAAVKAGRSLAPREIDDFLRQMREADVFSHCPHGRPVMKMFTAADIKRWFHRT